MSRANGTGNIFVNDVDRRDFGLGPRTLNPEREDWTAGRRQFEQRMEGRRREEQDGAEGKAWQRGWRRAGHAG